jgi:hypothetical protein
MAALIVIVIGTALVFWRSALKGKSEGDFLEMDLPAGSRDQVLTGLGESQDSWNDQ